MATVAIPEVVEVGDQRQLGRNLELSHGPEVAAYHRAVGGQWLPKGARQRAGQLYVGTKTHVGVAFGNCRKDHTVRLPILPRCDNGSTRLEHYHIHGTELLQRLIKQATALMGTR